MKFFVYTVEPGSRSSPVCTPNAVNAQPLREILSMMVIQKGRIYLHLPGNQTDPVLVRDYIITGEVGEALALTELTTVDFATVAGHVSDREPFSYAIMSLIKQQKAGQ